MTEQQVQSNILKYLNSLPECWAFKAESVTRGVPDIICCYQGHFLGFEVKKSARARASKIQIATLAKINVASGHGYIVHSLEQVKSALRNLEPRE